jgi:hypothetical protein
MVAAIRYIAANGRGWSCGSAMADKSASIQVSMTRWKLIVESGQEKRMNVCDAADG